MTIHPNADDFGPPRRKRSEPKTAHLKAVEEAQAKGRALTAAWYRANPLRRHYVRAVLRDEVLSETMPPFPNAILCTCLVGLEPPMFISMIVGASKELVADCREDRGEAYASALLELGKQSTALVRDELFQVRDGNIELLGVAR